MRIFISRFAVGFVVAFAFIAGNVLSRFVSRLSMAASWMLCPSCGVGQFIIGVGYGTLFPTLVLFAASAVNGLIWAGLWWCMCTGSRYYRVYRSGAYVIVVAIWVLEYQLGVLTR